MKSVLTCISLCLICFAVLADMPGNKPRKAVTVHVSFGDLDGYTIYSNGPYASYGEDKPVSDNSDHLLNGGFGAPPCMSFFGVDEKNKHTDTVMICNSEQGNVTLKLSVIKNKLVFDESSVQEDIVVPADTDSSSGSSSFMSNKINILVLVALASVLLLLAGYYKLQRKKQAL